MAGSDITVWIVGQKGTNENVACSGEVYANLGLREVVEVVG